MMKMLDTIRNHNRYPNIIYQDMKNHFPYFVDNIDIEANINKFVTLLMLIDRFIDLLIISLSVHGALLPLHLEPDLYL